MAFEYLFAALPHLPKELGAKLPLSPTRIANLCAEEGGGVKALSEHILASVDLKALQSLHLHREPRESAIFTVEALKEREGLPAWLALALEAEDRREHPHERAFGEILWADYYRELVRIVEAHPVHFLQRWLAWEVAFRNAMAAFRAHTFQRGPFALDVEVPEAFHSDEPFDLRPLIDVILSLQERGFAAWREIEKEITLTRLRQVRKLSQEYTFDLNELMSYIVTFIILHEAQWLLEGSISPRRDADDGGRS